MATAPEDSSRRWLGVGRSSSPDSVAAAYGAVEGALTGPEPKLLVVFGSDSYDLPALLGAIRERAPEVPLIGCSTAGEFALTGPGDSGVVVIAFGGDGFSAATASATGVAGSLHEAGAEAARCMTGLDGPDHRVLLVLTDGLAGDQQEIVRGAHSVVGAGVPLVGGCAGDDMRMLRTKQLCDDQVLENGVVAAALASDAPFGIGVRHGWRRVGDPMLVTKSAGTRVLTIDDRPALDVYLERHDPPPEVRTDPAAFTRFALTHPLGLDRRTGEEQIRVVGEAHFEERSLECLAEVPQGGLAWLMEGDHESVLAATDEACKDALAPLDGRELLGMVAFDCIGRRGVLGDEGIRAEVDRVAERAGGAPVAGFYTYGEIARTHGVSGFHNQTLVVLAVS